MIDRLRLIMFSRKALSKLNKESRPRAGRWRCCTGARHRGETSISTSVSPQPAVIPTSPATRHPPPLPVPYKTGLKLAMRRREHHTCHSCRSLPPPPNPRPPSPAPTPPTRPVAPSTSNHEWTQTVKGGEAPPACAPPLSGVCGFAASERRRLITLDYVLRKGAQSNW